MNGGIRINKSSTLLFAFFILIIISGIGAAKEIQISSGTSKIQSAVNNASSGDIIILSPGNYYDNVNITKENLTIKSSSGNPDDTWVRAYSSKSDVFHVQADKTNIYGLKISGALATRCSAINLSWCRFCSVQNNKFDGNLRGINLLFAHWSVISDNTVTNSNEYGIDTQNATADVISGNKVYGNVRGINIGNSDTNTLKSNTVTNSSVFGFFICGRSDMNTIYNNNFNDVNTTIKNGAGNSYNTTKTAGTNIIGGPYIGGNYWGAPDGTGFSQKAVDNNGDGIADSVYSNISGSIYTDYLPLVISGNGTTILPAANFTRNVSSGNSPLTVLFTSTSTNATSLSWNFGDGTAVVNGTQVSHTFNNTGNSSKNFTVTLTATNTNGTSNKTGSISVNPVAVVKPIASFSSSPASGGTTATTYTFNDTSTNSPTSWSWNFGDGATGSGKNVTHKYSAAKTYNVTLTVKNTAGNSTANKSVVVGTTTASVKPTASFTMSPTSGISTSTTCTFKSTSKNASTLTWNFGDGTTASGTSVTHKFVKAGTLTVTLTASNGAGSTTASKTVSVAAVKPVAAFSYSPTTLKHGATIKFTDTSSNIPTKWQWTFSDTTTKPTTNITSHVFSKAGTYTVTLYVYNSAGSNSIKKTLKVS